MGYDRYRTLTAALGPGARMAWDAIQMKPTRGIPSWMCHVMDPAFIEEMTGRPCGDYRRDPDGTYIEFQKLAGTCFIDQYLADNVLSMGETGFEAGHGRTATTGAERIELDGIVIDSPEKVVEHLERVVFPARARGIAQCNPDDPARIQAMIDGECELQEKLGTEILKGPYSNGFQAMPCFGYGRYGYENYFAAFALYPEVMERDFSQQADWAVLANRTSARAIVEGGLAPLVRLDHDIADGRGVLVGMKALEKLWLPHLARAIAPLLEAGVRLIWHCDGNLMELAPRLLEVGIGGFQGFQYEHGMDYERICRMKGRDGQELFIIAGISVTTTLPFGTRQDVIDQMKWLVEDGPRRGLMLGASSSIAPHTNHENLRTFIEGLRYYREHGRG